MFKLDAKAQMVFRVLRRVGAISQRKVAESGAVKIFLKGAGVKQRAERYNRR